MMDQRFHVVLHLFTAGRYDLVIIDDHGSRVVLEPLDTLLDDPCRLAHLLDPNQIAIVAIAVYPHRDIEFQPVVHRIGLLLAQIPFYPGAAQQGAAKP